MSVMLTLDQALHLIKLALDFSEMYKANWQPIESAPKDGRPILGWCDHEADPYFVGERLTLYGGHAEGLGHVEDGPNVLVWGGGWVDDHGYMPDWWFLKDSHFEIAANPTHWMSIPEKPNEST